jgi:hypothetical protein
MASIQISKVIIRGEQKYQINHIDDTKDVHELPAKYTTLGEYYVAYGVVCNELVLYLPSNTKVPDEFNNTYKGASYIKIRIAVRDIYSPDAVYVLMFWLRACGERLSKINTELEKANADWHGIETYEF